LTDYSELYEGLNRVMLMTV